MLALLETLTAGLRRKGILFEEYLKLYDMARGFPTWKVALGAQEQFCFNEAEAEKVAGEMKERYLEEIEGAQEAGDVDGGGNGDDEGETKAEDAQENGDDDRREARAMRQSVRLQKALVAEARTEAGPEGAGVSEGEMQTVGVGVSRLHIREAEDIPKLLVEIKALGLTEENLHAYVVPADIDPDDPQTMYPFVLEFTDKETKPIWSLTEILPMIRYVGQHSSGIDVQRFKGLGEMNADELWNTTMDPAQRILKRVTIEEAIDADRMFGILMGEHVEARREYIQAHALEVVELDV
jgi:DNA gyrase/topoisomerase IV subunit B